MVLLVSPFLWLSRPLMIMHFSTCTAHAEKLVVITPRDFYCACCWLYFCASSSHWLRTLGYNDWHISDYFGFSFRAVTLRFTFVVFQLLAMQRP